MKVDFDEFQEALVDGRIDIHQFLEVMIDNFGQKKAFEIIKKNLDGAAEKYDEIFDLSNSFDFNVMHDQYSEHFNLWPSR